MKQLIRKILKEEVNVNTLKKIHSMIELGKIKEPYPKSLELLGFDEDEIKEILSPLLNKYLKNIQPPYYKELKSYGLSDKEIELLLPKIFKKKGVEWYKHRGYSFDINYKGNEIYIEDKDGDWVEQKFDRNDRIIYHRKSNGNWYKLEFDRKGNTIYWENSNDGVLIDKR